MMQCPSKNKAFGFYGTAACQGIDADSAWSLATQNISSVTGGAPAAICDFLDSRHGRHFADELSNQRAQGLSLEVAIAATVSQYQTWTIDRKTSRQYGIPHGIAFLAGWVGYFEGLGETASEFHKPY